MIWGFTLLVFALGVWLLWKFPSLTESTKTSTDVNGKVTTTETSGGFPVIGILTALGAGAFLAIPVKWAWEELARRRDHERALDQKVLDRRVSRNEKYYIPFASSVLDLAKASEDVANASSGDDQRIMWLYRTGTVSSNFRRIQLDGPGWDFNDPVRNEVNTGWNEALTSLLAIFGSEAEGQLSKLGTAAGEAQGAYHKFVVMLEPPVATNRFVRSLDGKNDQLKKLAEACQNLGAAIFRGTEDPYPRNMPIGLTPQPTTYGLVKEYILGVLRLLTVTFLALFIGAATIWTGRPAGASTWLPLLLFACSGPILLLATWLALKGYNFAKVEQAEKDAARAEREGRGGPLI